MLFTKFIYDLLGKPEPNSDELDEEIDRLLRVKGVEEVTFRVPPKEQDQLSLLDSEVITLWIRRRFEPALLLWILGKGGNHHKAQSELAQMERYNTRVDKFFRINFVERRAMQRIRELCFDDVTDLKLPQVTLRLKRALTFLSKHLEENNPECLTLQGFEAYTVADEFLYKYLKRILFGKFKDQGLRSHVKLCDPLVRFMNRFEKKNPYVHPGDPLANEDDQTSLIKDIALPATVAMGFILIYLWRKS